MKKNMTARELHRLRSFKNTQRAAREQRRNRQRLGALFGVATGPSKRESKNAGREPGGRRLVSVEAQPLQRGMEKGLPWMGEQKPAHSDKPIHAKAAPANTGGFNRLAGGNAQGWHKPHASPIGATVVAKSPMTAAQLLGAPLRLKSQPKYVPAFKRNPRLVMQMRYMPQD